MLGVTVAAAVKAAAGLEALTAKTSKSADTRGLLFCRLDRVESTCDDIVCESHQLASTTLPADINEELSHTIRNAGVSMATWRSNGSAPIKLTLFQSLLLARHVGGGGGRSNIA